MIEREPESLTAAAEYLVRHRDAFVDQLAERANVLRTQFEAIDVLKYRQTFDQVAVRAATFLEALPSG